MKGKESAPRAHYSFPSVRFSYRPFTLNAYDNGDETTHHRSNAFKCKPIPPRSQPTTTTIAMVMVSATMESSCLTEDDDVAHSPCHCGSIGNRMLPSLCQCIRLSTRLVWRNRLTRRHCSESIRARSSYSLLVFALLLASSIQTSRSDSDDSDVDLFDDNSSMGGRGCTRRQLQIQTWQERPFSH